MVYSFLLIKISMKILVCKLYVTKYFIKNFWLKINHGMEWRTRIQLIDQSDRTHKFWGKPWNWQSNFIWIQLYLLISWETDFYFTTYQDFNKGFFYNVFPLRYLAGVLYWAYLNKCFFEKSAKKYWPFQTFFICFRFRKSISQGYSCQKDFLTHSWHAFSWGHKQRKYIIYNWAKHDKTHHTSANSRKLFKSWWNYVLNYINISTKEIR